MPCNPALEHFNCCALSSIVDEPTLDTFLSSKPPAVLLDVGTNSNKNADDEHSGYHAEKISAKINNVSIIKCLANPMTSIIADEIIVDSGSAFHVISEDLIPQTYGNM